jgi:tripartite-type tricarboxylate transporter receptor subunit TctC
MKFLSILILGLCSSLAHASDWTPSQPVKVIIPAPPGSLHDAGFKSVQSIIEKNTGTKFVIEYKPGASSIVATKHFLSLPADDHTLLVGTSISHVMSVITHPTLVEWKPLDDFTFVSGLITGTLVIANSSKSKINSPEKFLEHLKSSTIENPVKIGVTFPNQEVAISQILEFFKLDSRIVKFVKYTDPTKTLIDVVRGDVDYWIGGVSPTVALYKSKELNYIASLSNKPLEFLPGVPLLKDYVPGVIQLSTVGVLMHKDSNPAAVNWFNKQIANAVNSKESSEIRFQGLVSIDENSLTPDGFKNVMKNSFDSLSPGYRKIYK